MPDEYEIDEKKGIFEIRSYGILTKKNMEDSIEKALLAKKNIGIDKLIINTSELKSVPGTLDIFEVMANLSQQLKIALIVKKGQPTADEIQFGETVATNRGGKVKIFSSKECALEWLQGAT